MSTLKNKGIIYAVVRKDYSDDEGFSFNKDTICCFTKTYERSTELAQQYEQEFLDRGIPNSSFDFYVVGNVFYDE